MIILKKTLPLTMLLVIAATPLAQAYGGKPGELFDWGMGARSLGMGKAFTAAADDSSAAYWNPAAMPQLNRQEIGMLHGMLWEGTAYDALSYVYPTALKRAFGASLVRIGSSGFDGRDADNMPTGSFTAADTGLKLGYGQMLSRTLSVGTALNYLSRAVGSYSSSLYSFDLAALYRPGGSRSFALKAGNIFSFAGGETEDEMPLNLRLGYAQKFAGDRLAVALDYGMPDQWYTGFEVALNPLFLRLGINYEEMSVGLGFAFKDYRLDYALAQQTELGLSHRVSFNVKFGDDLAKQREKIVNAGILQGDRQAEKGSFNKALRSYDAAMRLETKPAAAKRYERLKTLMDQAELADFPAKLKGNEQKSAELACKGVVDYVNGRKSAALWNVQQALGASPDNPVLKSFEELLKKEGAVISDEDMAPDAKVAMKLHRAVTYFQEEKYDLATRECQEAVRLAPDNALAHMRLGSVYYAVGLKDKAVAEWQKSLELDPQNAELQEFMKEAGEAKQ